MQHMSGKFQRYQGTPNVADMFGVHPYNVSKIFPYAYVARIGSGKIYDLEAIASEISRNSSYVIKAHDLPRLIDMKDSMRLLKDKGAGRCLRTWKYWAQRRIGPREFKVNCLRFYLPEEVELWAVQLRTRTGHFLPMLGETA